jgi:predicted metal-binding protein
MAYSFVSQADTPSTTLEYTINILEICPDVLSDIVDKGKFNALCASGCSNYKQKWSCPPFAPIYQRFVDGWKHLYMLYVRIEISQFGYIRNNYLKIKAANAVLKTRVDKYLRNMAMQYGKYISTGSCRICKPCKCKQERLCAHPDIMSYSFEALGVNVGVLVEQYFQSKLLWYKPNYLPRYTSVVCGLLSNTVISCEALHDEYVRIVKQPS